MTVFIAIYVFLCWWLLIDIRQYLKTIAAEADAQRKIRLSADIGGDD